MATSKEWDRFGEPVPGVGVELRPNGDVDLVVAAGRYRLASRDAHRLGLQLLRAHHGMNPRTGRP